MGNKFAFFYPENNERSAPIEFNTAEEAIEYFCDRRSSWQSILPMGKNDKAAFLSPLGEIVVVRELTEDE